MPQADAIAANQEASSDHPLRIEITRLATGKRKLFTISKLAKEAGITRSHLSNFVNGKRQLSPESRNEVEMALKRMSVTHGDMFAQRRHYLRLVTDRVHGFELRVLLPGTKADEFGYVGVERFFVEQVYHALKPDLNSPADYYRDGIDSLPNREPVLHILGPAGSGKTTAIRRQILRLAQRGDGPLPIFFPLNALNRYLPSPQAVFSPPTEMEPQIGAAALPKVANLCEAISLWTKTNFHHDFSALFEYALKSGDAFVMLDGLDEVHSGNSRAAINLINYFISNHTGIRGKRDNTVLITQRGYQPFAPSKIFVKSTVFEIREFNTEQIELLVDKWLGVFGDAITHDPSLLSVSDIANMSSLLEKFGAQHEETDPSPGKRIMTMLPQRLMREILERNDSDSFLKFDERNLVFALNEILRSPDFYRPLDFEDIPVSEETKTLLSRRVEDLSQSEVERRNRLLLEDAYPGEIGRSRVRRPLDNVTLFKEALLQPPLDKLTTNPFFLTLITAIFLSRGLEEVFVEPAKSSVLNSYYRAILGVWNSVRSLDGFPTPTRNRFPHGLSHSLLSHLAWEMIEGGRDITRRSIPYYQAVQALASRYERYSFGGVSPVPTDPRIKEEAEAFIHISKDAGVLTQDSSGDVTFVHEIVRIWFVISVLRSRPNLLREYLEAYIVAPSPERVWWTDPLSLTLSAIGAVDENLESLRESVEFAFDTFPLHLADLNLVLPLGLELGLQLLEDGGLYPGLERAILKKLRDFFERTEYAVLTDCLQPRIVRLLPRADWASEIPRDEAGMAAWLQEIETIRSDRKWAAKIDRIWRYQTNISCFDLLFSAVDDRLRKGDLHEKLYRRLVFGLRFAHCEPQLKVDRLDDVVKRSDLNPVIISMALYALKNIHWNLKKEPAGHEAILNRISEILREVNGSDHRPPNLTSTDAKTVSQLVDNLTQSHIQLLVEQSKSEILEEFLTNSGLAEEKIIDGLVHILDLPGESDEVNRRRAVAIVLLVSIFENHIFNRSYECLYPRELAKNYARAGSDNQVLTALLRAAKVDEKKQHENVDACQVYDFAAWGIRRIFLQASDLSSLPLPPPGDLDARHA